VQTSVRYREIRNDWEESVAFLFTMIVKMETVIPSETLVTTYECAECYTQNAKKLKTYSSKEALEML
jgi:hypothetical protein